MPAPVIDSPLTLNCTVGVTPTYTIHATNYPTSFGAGLPASLTIDTLTGRLGGKVDVAATYNSGISATNAIGTDTQTLQIIAEETGGGTGGNGSVLVYRGKLWANDDERSDYADLDAAGHPVAAFASQVIGSGRLKAGEVAKKVGWLGGPGIVGQFILPNDYVTVPQVRYSQILGQVTVTGATVGDVVIMGDMLLPDGTRPPSPSTLENIVFFGVATLNMVAIYAFPQSGSTGLLLPGLSRFNFRVFGFPNG